MRRLQRLAAEFKANIVSEIPATQSDVLQYKPYSCPFAGQFEHTTRGPHPTLNVHNRLLLSEGNTFLQYIPGHGSFHYLTKKVIIKTEKHLCKNFRLTFSYTFPSPPAGTSLSHSATSCAAWWRQTHQEKRLAWHVHACLLHATSIPRLFV